MTEVLGEGRSRRVKTFKPSSFDQLLGVEAKSKEDGAYLKTARKRGSASSSSSASSASSFDQVFQPEHHLTEKQLAKSTSGPIGRRSSLASLSEIADCREELPELRWQPLTTQPEPEQMELGRIRDAVSFNGSALFAVPRKPAELRQGAPSAGITGAAGSPTVVRTSTTITTTAKSAYLCCGCVGS